jgi:uncharacterized protein YjiS (DUF1127 family)
MHSFAQEFGRHRDRVSPRYQLPLDVWLLQTAGKLWRRFNKQLEYLRKRRELMALDDRMLKDIGISRMEIDYAVYHGRPRD